MIAWTEPLGPRLNVGFRRLSARIRRRHAPRARPIEVSSRLADHLAASLPVTPQMRWRSDDEQPTWEDAEWQ